MVQSGIINSPEYGQLGLMDKMADMTITCKESLQKCRCPDTVGLGKHSARGMNSITLIETHDENMPFFGSRQIQL